MSELKILELFGGIGACTKALERQNIPHKVVDYVEIDKHAVKSYNAVHGTDFEPRKDGMTNTITSVQKDNYVLIKTANSQGVLDGCRIRKLTPKECWRLMGFDDADFEKAEKVNSNTQLYKQAGNSIVVNVLEGILSNLVGGEK